MSSITSTPMIRRPPSRIWKFRRARGIRPLKFGRNGKFELQFDLQESEVVLVIFPVSVQLSPALKSEKDRLIPILIRIVKSGRNTCSNFVKHNYRNLRKAVGESPKTEVNTREK